MSWLPIKPAKTLELRVGPVTESRIDTSPPPRYIYIHVLTRKTNMALILTDEQQVTLTLLPKTNKGNPAKIDGVPTWSTSNPAVLTVTADPADPTGLTALAVAVGPVGTAQVQVVADADLSPEVRQLTSVLDVEVVAAEAVTLDIAAGVPTLTP